MSGDYDLVSCAGCSKPVGLKAPEADGKRYCATCTGAIVGYTNKRTGKVYCDDPICLVSAPFDPIWVPVAMELAGDLTCTYCSWPLVDHPKEIAR